jgi:metallo-beta-lactamase family protein
MDITFLGAAGTVTGSKYLLTIDNKHILIDCGLFQGLKELRLKNWDKLPISPKNIDAVILTHAHIDHSGYLPLLVKNGFRGKIYSTHGTFDLCKILLPDSGHLQEEEAEYANKHAYSKHHPALPLYTVDDANAALKHFVPLDFTSSHSVLNNLHFKFYPAGHIVGASLVELSYLGKTILFSGDLGRPHDEVMKAPTIITSADYLILESTYGDKLHDSINTLDRLASIIDKTINRGGSVIIPAFAVGRAQSLLYFISQLRAAKRIPIDLPVFLDSPMAIDASNLLCRYHAEHRLSEKQCNDFGKVATYTHTADESKSIDNRNTPAIIISASGMATGGRILHHLKKFLPDEKNTILFTGYQAVETRGDRLLRGEKEVKMLGEIVPVRAEILSISTLSAHADYREILDWLKNFKHPPTQVFITHGEKYSANSLKQRITTELGWSCMVPTLLQTEHLV